MRGARLVYGVEGALVLVTVLALMGTNLLLGMDAQAQTNGPLGGCQGDKCDFVRAVTYSGGTQCVLTVGLLRGALSCEFPDDVTPATLGDCHGDYCGFVRDVFFPDGHVFCLVTIESLRGGMACKFNLNNP